MSTLRGMYVGWGESVSRVVRVNENTHTLTVRPAHRWRWMERLRARFEDFAWWIQRKMERP